MSDSSAIDRPASDTSVTAGAQFVPHALAVVAYADGYTLWHYRAPNNFFLLRGYFNSAAEMFRPGDDLIVTYQFDASSERARGHVSRIDGDEVTVKWEGR